MPFCKLYQKRDIVLDLLLLSTIHFFSYFFVHGKSPKAQNMYQSSTLFQAFLIYQHTYDCTNLRLLFFIFGCKACHQHIRLEQLSLIG